MSSYLSKDRQYNNYVPDINSDLYAGLLAKKDTDYKQGVQKVENAITQVASLPVGNAADRDYLQSKVNSITSELNQQHGVDWSDQHLNNLTTRHITSIASDPTVQTAISSAMSYKADFQKHTDDYNENGENVVANHYDWAQGASSYLNAEAPGTRYSAKYTSYIDVNKKVEDFMKNLKPDEDINTLLAGADIDPATGKKIPVMSTYDQVIRKYKGRDREKVLASLNAFVDNTPGIREQLNINGKYEYRNFNGGSYAQEYRGIEQAQKQGAELELSRKNQLLMFTKDPKEVSKLNDSVKKLQDFIKEKDFNINNQSLWRKVAYMYELAPDEEKTALKQEKYMDKWKTEQANLFSSGTLKSLTYGGESPFGKQMQLAAMGDRRKKEAFDEWLALQNLDIAKTKADKEKKEVTPHIVDLGVNPSIAGQAYQHLQGEVTTNDSMLKQDKLRFLYNTMSDVQKSQYFKPVVNNQIVVKSGKIKDPDSGDDVEIKDYLDNTYNRFQDAFNDGTYKVGGVQMDKKQITHFIESRRLNTIQTLAKDKLERAKKSWEYQLKEDPETIRLTQQIDELNKPFTGSYGTYTAADISNYLQARKELQEEASKPQNYAGDPYAKQDEISRKYGISLERFNELQNHFMPLSQKATDLQSKKDEFLNNQVLTGSRLYRPQEVMLTSGKEETNVDVIKIAQGILQAAKAKGGDDDYKEASAILSPADEKTASKNINIGYWFDEAKGQYYLKIGNGAKQTDVPISPLQAKQMKLASSNPYREIEKVLDLNASGSGSSNTGTGGVMTYENADPVGYINNGNYEVRVHYERDDNGYYANIYTRNVNNPSDLQKVQLDPVPSLSQAVQGIDEWIQKHKTQK